MATGNTNAMIGPGSGPAEWLLTPGHAAWDWLSTASPAIARGLAGGAEPGALFIAGLAIAAWLFLLLAAAVVLRGLARFALWLAHSVGYWLGNAWGDLRVKFIVRLKRLDWRRRHVGFVQQEIELDPMDLAVLDHGATLAPGFAISVTDLSERLHTRPSLIERSLAKLHQHKLVDTLMGSTDGYGNYRLTDSGAWYVAAQRGGGPPRIEPHL